MSPTDNEDPHEPDGPEIHRQNMIALAFVALLVVVGVWLVGNFKKSIQLEECVEAGRRNCAPLDMEKTDK